MEKLIERIIKKLKGKPVPDIVTCECCQIRVPKGCTTCLPYLGSRRFCLMCNRKILDSVNERERNRKGWL